MQNEKIGRQDNAVLMAFMKIRTFNLISEQFLGANWFYLKTGDSTLGVLLPGGHKKLETKNVSDRL